MCEFISWLKVEKNGEKHILYLDDQELFSERNREILKGSKDNDFIGHHALREVYNLADNEGEQGECKDFWETDRLPKEIQPKLKDFQTLQKNFGKMLENYAQKDDLQYIVKNAPTDKKWRGLKKFCREVLSTLPMRDVKTEVLSVNVRHDLSVDELVKLNKFGWANDCITSANYPAKKGSAKKQELVLVSVGRDASTADVLKTMKTLKLKAAKPIALLSLGLDHPNRQKENPIVALGQFWRDSYGLRYVPCLYFGSGRRLYLDYLGVDWCSNYRFLAVRNS